MRPTLLSIFFVLASAFALGFTPGAARAQNTFDLIPYAGYRIGGGLTDNYTGTHYDVKDDVVYGGAIDVRLQGGKGIEFLYSTQDTRFVADGYYSGPQGETPLRVDYWHIGGIQEKPVSEVTSLYGAGTLGLTAFHFPDETPTRFSLGFGGGAKIMPKGGRVGLRLDARLYTTFVGSSTYYVSGGTGGLAVGFASEVLFQGEFTGGVVVRLGGR
jgi:hypothetical protein